MIRLLLALVYPALVYFALDVASPRALGFGVLAVCALRIGAASERRLAVVARVAGPVAAAIVAAGAASLVWNDARALLLAPALVNLALLAAFGSSFASRETIVETLAFEQGGTLSPERRSYCRKVTAIWCGFFVANAGVISWIALLGTRERWALYTGLIAYLLMALLFSTEFVYRHWRFRRYLGLPTDALMRRIFPPSPTK